MKERPILFSGPMVRAILEGRKTQTRRPMKPKLLRRIEIHCASGVVAPEDLSPYGRPGSRLWVRETWGIGTRPDPVSGWIEGVEYRADEAYCEDCDHLLLNQVKTPDDIYLSDYRPGWHPSIHMPRWASRLTLEITETRAEQIQDISREDIRAEGVGLSLSPCFPHKENRSELHSHFAALWDSIYGSGSWNKNPCVWVLEFKRI